MQWAALIIHNGSTNTAPHQWPKNPSDGWSSSSETCHGNCPSFVGEPSIIFGMRYFELILGCRRNGLTPHSKKRKKRKFIIKCRLYAFWKLLDSLNVPHVKMQSRVTSWKVLFGLDVECMIVVDAIRPKHWHENLSFCYNFTKDNWHLQSYIHNSLPGVDSIFNNTFASVFFLYIFSLFLR